MQAAEENSKKLNKEKQLQKYIMYLDSFSCFYFKLKRRKLLTLSF
jgi:uncharacterized protein YutD